MIIQVYACLSFNRKGIYTLRLETGQNGVNTYTWEGQLYSFCGILNYYSTVLHAENMQNLCQGTLLMKYWGMFTTSISNVYKPDNSTGTAFQREITLIQEAVEN